MEAEIVTYIDRYFFLLHINENCFLILIFMDDLPDINQAELFNLSAEHLLVVVFNTLQ